jgi:membrane-associated protease RseP (regulator of RpoE activity)
MPDKNTRTILLQVVLFIITIITTTLAGTEWIFGRFFFLNDDGIGWNNWLTQEKLIRGLQFSIPFLGILTVHEFGHYFTARWYKVKVTLPYYIPFWFGLGNALGTMGAFIRIKQIIQSRKEYFDIGLAGPLAGFIVALGVLWYGFTHLPPPEYIFGIHPEYQKYGLDYASQVYKNVEGSFSLGNNLLFWFFENYVADPALLPNKYEMMHYPFIFAGYLACFFTALNLMPIGQLDGGHILYGLVGSKVHKYVSVSLFIVFVFYAGLGVLTPYKVDHIFDSDVLIYLLLLYFMFSRVGGTFKNTFLIAFAILTAQFTVSYFFPYAEGYNGWMVFAFILGRFLGVYHPQAVNDEPLDWKRKTLGWLSLVIFIVCFTPTPFVFE